LILLLLAGWAKSAQAFLHLDSRGHGRPHSGIRLSPRCSHGQAGAFLIARIFCSGFEVSAGIGILTAVVAILTMYVGLIFYFLQDDLKKLLAYSTITNVGYIFLAWDWSMGSVVGSEEACCTFCVMLLPKPSSSCPWASSPIAPAPGSCPVCQVSAGSPFLAFVFIIGFLSVTGIPPSPVSGASSTSLWPPSD